MSSKPLLPRPSQRLLPVLIALSSLSLSASAWSCEHAAGHVASLEGRVELKTTQTSRWLAVKPGETLCVGDTVRVLELSRAALVLVNDVVLRLDQKSTLTLGADQAEQPAALDLSAGVVHLLTRYRQRLGVHTPFMNALVDGTEFSVDSRDDSARVTVAEGTVQAVTNAGRLSLQQGESAGTEGVDVAPQALTIRPVDAVQWALYYPMIIAPPATHTPIDDKCRDGLGACTIPLDLTAATPTLTSRAALYRANQLLSLGRVDEAQSLLSGTTFEGADDATDRQALLTLISIIKNDLSANADDLEVTTAAAALARSYVRQAQSRIPDALAAARLACELSPQHAAAWARSAELRLLMNDVHGARQDAAHALALAPETPRARGWLAYADLLDGKRTAAEAGFIAEIARFPGDPLPHLGLGMLRIASGALAQGRRELEVAVMLDPGNAELRAYLGRAYLEEARHAVAATQFEVARALDPQNPAPWLQDALRKAAENQPGAAVEDVQAALARNDARALLRPRFLLDQDRAAKNTNLANLYREIGFDQLALDTAREALRQDPQSAVAHRFLADSYATQPGSEVARVSELLQAQIRQPLGTRLIQPQTLESNLPVLGALAPTASYQELNPLFSEGRRQIGVSAFVGNHNTFSETLNVGTVRGNTGLSLGQYHYKTDGIRDNGDFTRDVLDLLLQQQISVRASVQAELLNTRGKSGDIAQRFDETFNSPTLRRDFDSTRLRLGARYAPTPDQEWLGVVVAQNRDDHVRDGLSLGPLTQNLSLSDAVSARGFELQYSQRQAHGSLTLGGGSYREHAQQLSRFTVDFGPFNLLDLNTNDEPKLRHNNAYLYARHALTSEVNAIGGLSLDEYDAQDRLQRHAVNPKLGLVWQIDAQTRLRLAAFRVLKRSLVGDQTLEPTEVAGFTQLFDDPNGTTSRRIGLGIDRSFGAAWHAGAEVSARRLSVPFLMCETGGVCLYDWREKRHRAYVYWQADSRWSLGADYLFETLDKRTYPGTASNSPVAVDTRELPLSLTYHSPAGWFVRPVLRAVSQRVVSPSPGGLSYGHEHFWVADAIVGLRRAQGRLQWSLEARNLFNQGFRFQDTNLNDEPRAPRFQPDRAVLLRVTATF